MFHAIAEFFRKLFGKKCKVKKTRLTQHDIEENILRIKAAMDKTPIGTQQYETLQNELEKEQTILKKFKEAHQYMAPKDAWVIAGTGLLCFFVIALNREWPAAVKTAATILKFIPFKG